jgi:ubiquinone/menaquinone biosynthesis C-methylase UbiE
LKRKNNIAKEVALKEIDSISDLYPFQKDSLKKVLSIIYSCFKTPDKISVLDVGCSASHVKYLSKYVKEIVGINLDITSDKSNIESIDENYKFIQMDGTHLEFPDNSFDFVYSSNVFEHINDLPLALSEQQRVVKRNGYIYAVWYPIWSGPRGHHVHDDESFVAKFTEKYGETKIKYVNNGEIIPDWHHLIFSPTEMHHHLSGQFQNDAFTNAIVDWIYKSNELNRLFFEDIDKLFHSSSLFRVFGSKMKLLEIPAAIYEKITSKHAYSDFTTAGYEVLFTKKSGLGKLIRLFKQVLLKRLQFIKT